jgi:predicted DNA-binding protein (MmcQ/YjbR family)
MNDVAARWAAVRRFAAGLPNAAEDTPWGDVLVVKVEKRDGDPPAWRRHLVHGPVFLWLGGPGAGEVAVKLTASHEAARALAGAVPTTASGLGHWGWLTVPLAAPVDVDLLCDWVEESYRNVAPKKLVRQLDERPR